MGWEGGGGRGEGVGYQQRCISNSGPKPFDFRFSHDLDFSLRYSGTHRSHVPRAWFGYGAVD